MSSISKREQIIQEKRKHTSRHDFVMQIGTWFPMTFHNIGGNVSRYPQTERITQLVSSDEFATIMDSPVNQLDYDPTKSFFDQFAELYRNQQFPYVWHVGQNDNSQYSDTCFNTRNAYLSTCVCFDVENILYSLHVAGQCTDVVNSVFVSNGSSIVYNSSDVTESQNVFYSRSINNCYNTWFSTNLIGCQECLGCSDLTNQSYCIDNVQYTKEQYQEKKQAYIADKLVAWYTVDVSSDSSLYQCEDLEQAQYCSYVQHGRNVCFVSPDKQSEKKNLYDVISSWSQIDGAYACMGVSPWEHFYCTINSGFAHVWHVMYSMFLAWCSYCLGCIGLKNKQFCIFNKQYTKEERFRVADEILWKMHAAWTLGDFFPASLCPFYVNDTIASLLDQSITKEQAVEQWYLRRDETLRVWVPEWVEVVQSRDLGGYEWYMVDGGFVSRSENLSESWEYTIHPDILNKVIVDEWGDYYRIIPLEYKFLKKHWLLLPREHWLKRLKRHFME